MNDTPPKPLDPFRKMADRIDHNSGSSFSGAAVIVDPTGRTVEFLVLDEAQSTAQFWSILKTRIELVFEEIKNEGRSPFGR